MQNNSLLSFLQELYLNNKKRFCCLVAMKAKLLKQVLVQSRGLFRCLVTLENGDSPLKDHISFLLKPAVFIELKRGGHVFLYKYLASSWRAGVLYFQLSVCLGPIHLSFYLLAHSV